MGTESEKTRWMETAPKCMARCPREAEFQNEKRK
jgi:hypothetical protein